MKRLSLALLCLIAVGCKEQQGQTVNGADIVRSQTPRCAPNQYLTSDADGSMKCNDLPVGTIGQNGQDGQQGADGRDGAALLMGAGDPATTLGKESDSYIDSSSFNIWKKSDTSWQQIGNIKGAAGANGQSCSVQSVANGVKVSCSGVDAIVSNGANGAAGANGTNGTAFSVQSSDPVNAAGVNGDSVLNESSLDLFKKQNGSWVKVANIKGAKGDKGDQGISGVNGADGAAGQAGIDGKDGFSLVSGAADPTALQGKTGDTYIQMNSGDVFFKEASGWSKTGNIKGAKGDDGANGIDGINGKDGLGVYSDANDPSANAGKDGDTFINSVSGDVFQKVSSSWLKTGNIKGPKGADGINGIDGVAGAKGDQGIQGVAGVKGADGLNGSSLIVGSGDPTLANGKDGDSFIDEVTASLWKRVSGAWTMVKNLVGPKGDAGQRGADGQQGIQGVAGVKGDRGDQGIQGVAGAKGDRGDQGLQGLDGAKGDRGEQGIQGVAGPKGDRGDQGIAGQNGNSILVGSQAPTAAEGKDGDSFIDKLTADLWNRVNGTWQKIVNLVGPKGDAGQNGTNGVDGQRGADGLAGAKGDAGASCTTEQVTNGIKVTCGDGTTAILYSSDGTVKAFARTDLPTCAAGQLLTAAGGALSCVTIPSDSTKLSVTGGTMSGSIDMGAVMGSVDNRIRNLTDPELSQDAATKAYVDSKTASLSTQVGQTINVTPTTYLTQINNLRTAIIVGDVKIKFAAGTYTIPATTVTTAANQGLYINHSFANRITLEGDLSVPTAVKFVGATTSASILTVAPYAKLARIESIAFESHASGTTGGVIRLLQQSGVTLSNVSITAVSNTASNRAALSLEDGAEVVFLNNSFISGNGASIARGIACNGQSRIIFSQASGGQVTVSNYSPNITLPVVDAQGGCRIIGRDSTSLTLGAGLTTKPAINTTITDSGYAGSYIGF